MDSLQLQEIDISDSVTVSVYTDGSIVEGGGVIWDAAHVLSRFIAKEPKGFKEYFQLDASKECRALELGAGTGYCGISLAKVFPHSKVVLTEMSEGSLKLMQKSIDENELTERVKAEKLLWGEQASHEIQLDFIIGSDIIYIEKDFPLLLQTIINLSQPTTMTLICNADHGNLDKFEDFLATGPYKDVIKFAVIGHEWQHEVYQSDDIKIFLIELK